MRLKSDLWVMAYLRRCAGEGASAMLVRRGDADAGAIYIKISRLDGTAALYGPAPSGMEEAREDRRWQACFDRAPVTEAEADAFLARQMEFDPDIWLIEVEDRQGRHFLDGWLAQA
jgi:hypothetical protein